MATYTLPQLRHKWATGELTVEQLLGQQLLPRALLERRPGCRGVGFDARLDRALRGLAPRVLRPVLRRARLGARGIGRWRRRA